jgi:hypothetical protein
MVWSKNLRPKRWRKLPSSPFLSVLSARLTQDASIVPQFRVLTLINLKNNICTRILLIPDCTSNIA